MKQEQTYRKLQAAVYAIKYKEGIPLEFGCDVIVETNFKPFRKLIGREEDGIFQLLRTQLFDEEFDSGIMDRKLFKNLGKDLELSDIFLAINKDNGIREIAFFSKDEIVIYPFKGDYIIIDLTKPIKEQEQTVLEKLLELIKN